MKLGSIPIELNLIDTVGAEKFRSLNPSLFPNTRAGILVFDLSMPKTLPEIKYWYTQFREHCPNIPIIVVGNKSDIQPHAVKKVDIDRVIEEMNIVEYMETSAYYNTNIPELYDKIAEQAYKFSQTAFSNNQPKTHFKLNSEKAPKKKKKRC